MFAPTVLQPFEQRHYVGDQVPLGFQGGYLLSEAVILDGWELYGNPDRETNPLILELNLCQSGDPVTARVPVLGCALVHWRAEYPARPTDPPLGVYLPARSFLGIWVVEAATDYYLFRPTIRRAPLRVPLPGEGETVGDA